MVYDPRRCFAWHPPQDTNKRAPLPHKLERDAEMVAEVEVVQHVYDMVASVRVLLPQLVQYPNLDEGLMVEALLVADDLDCDVLLGFVVQRPDHLSEAALADNLQDLVPVADVVMHNLQTKKQRKAKESMLMYQFVSGADCLGAEAPHFLLTF